MLNYTCKYTPIEIFKAFGTDCELIDQEETNFEQAEILTHANLCSHAKAFIQEGINSEEIVIMDCCDSLRRAYDVLDFEGKNKYLKILGLPHENGYCAKEQFSKILKGLIKEYSEKTGRKFDKDLFIQACKDLDRETPKDEYIAILGARVSPELEKNIKESLGFNVVNLTCSGNRNLEDIPEEIEEYSFDELIDWYAAALLRMIPCMRMTNIADRKQLINDPKLKGIVYNTVKFCDFYNFDYSDLKQTTDIPILKIESDFMQMPSGQLSTRLEAFTESLGGTIVNKNKKMKKDQKGLYAGIDSGSTTTNMVVIDQDKNVVASTIVRTGAKAQNGAKKALENICNNLNVNSNNFNSIMATGYGRNNIPFATDTKTEITCHANGAHYLNPNIRTIIDIGGQDSKVICLDETGNVSNFIMNDKCAAGTGRFLEMMARTLEMDLSDMSEKGLNWNKDLTISSMCTVFAESEVISLIADNHTDRDIIHGLNKSIASKTASMVKRAKGIGDFMMTGGVARNKGVVNALESKLGEGLYITENPDLCGALGAALFALEG